MTTGPAAGFATTGIENHPGHSSQKSHGRKGGANFDATTGRAAVASAAVKGTLTDVQVAAIDDYGNDGFFAINTDLRTTGVVRDEYRTTAVGIDSVMSSSALTEDVVVYRNFNATQMFGSEATGGDLTGLRWSDGGFVSTSGSERPRATGATTMRIFVPAGTHGFSHPEMDRDEVLLDRGLTFEVLADTGSGSARQLDVMVVVDD